PRPPVGRRDGDGLHGRDAGLAAHRARLRRSDAARVPRARPALIAADYRAHTDNVLELSRPAGHAHSRPSPKESAHVPGKPMPLPPYRRRRDPEPGLVAESAEAEHPPPAIVQVESDGC